MKNSKVCIDACLACMIECEKLQTMPLVARLVQKRVENV